MGKDSFDIDLANLFIALCKGSERLKPYSEKFSRELGYKIFRLEASFQLASGASCSPDLILQSKTLGHTLVVEWSQNPDLNIRKQKQLEKYSQITPYDLVNAAAVPAGSAKTYSMILILQPAACGTYISFLAAKGWPMPVFSFTKKDSGAVLTKEAHGISEPQTEEFFKNPFEIRNMPEGYLSFSLQHIKVADLVTPISTHLLSLIAQGKSKKVTLEEFCKGYLAGRFNIFQYLGKEKRTDFMTKTKSVLQTIAAEAKTADLLKQAGRNSSTWELLDQKSFHKRYASYHSGMVSVVNKLKGGGAIQPTLFD